MAKSTKADNKDKHSNISRHETEKSRNSQTNKRGKDINERETRKTDKASTDCSCCKCSKQSFFHTISCNKTIFSKTFSYSLAICVSVLVAIVAVQFASVGTNRRQTDSTNNTGEQRTSETANIDPEKPALTRIVPEKVNEAVEIELEEGKKHIRITRSLNPPIFEIPNFLTDIECERIKERSIENGLRPSTLFREGDIEVTKDIEESSSLKVVDRISDQTWLSYDTEYLKVIQRRVGRLTKLPDWIINKSEELQVVHYDIGGHYHAHIDSTENDTNKPCCHQASCDSTSVSCCKICRYVTVLYFLNDVDEGGETAFVYADNEESYEEDETERLNLSYYCHEASLVVKPKKGTAIMWYNHKMDTKTSYLGDVDFMSFHGGCDIIKGEKWIANSWINAPYYNSRHIPSIYGS